MDESLSCNQKRCQLLGEKDATKAGYYNELRWCADMVDLKTKAIHKMIRGTQAIPREPIAIPSIIRPGGNADKYRSADLDLACARLLLRPPIPGNRPFLIVV
jgi:hypothetical protein